MFSVILVVLDWTRVVISFFLEFRMSSKDAFRLWFSSLKLFKRLAFPSLIRVRMSTRFGSLGVAAWSNLGTSWATEGEDKDLLFG